MDVRLYQVARIIGAVSRGARTLEEVARSTDGLYLPEVKACLQQLQRTGDVVSEDGTGFRLTREITLFDEAVGKPIQITAPKNLPCPHPLDYDWRFDSTSRALMADRLLTESGTRGAILLIGAPSVFLELANRPLGPRITLLDNSASVTEFLQGIARPPYLNVVRLDLLSGALWAAPSPFDVVFCDPPWYPEHFRRFLVQATAAAVLGATVYFSLMQLCTRPEAPRERMEFLSTARGLGLHLAGISTAAVRYETPPFELASLRAAGIYEGASWRTGDVFELRKMHEPPAAELCGAKEATVDSAAGEWTSVSVGNLKVRLRGPFNDSETVPELIPIEPANVLPTVSRRYEGRQRVDLWLCDNRVFSVRGRLALLAALLSLAGTSCSSGTSRLSPHLVDRATELLVPLIAAPCSAQITCKGYV